MADDIFESERTRMVFWALHKAGITKGLMRLILPIYGKANKYDPKEFKIFAVGQSHLDSAWNWRWAPDTAPYKLSHTIGYNLERLKLFPQRNKHKGYQDGYKFSCPAPAHYEYVEKTWPRSFEVLKKYVKEGRWELLGGCWVEPDCNVPDGESFVRQRLYGQKYYMEKFGKKAVIAWMPDSFGFTHNLPQIFQKSGAIGFFTTKLTWNVESRPGTGKKFPFGWFYWKDQSGTQVLSYNFKNGWRGLEYIGAHKELCRLVKKNSLTDKEFSYETNFETDNRLSTDFINEVLWSYGQGDGGHGPNPLEIMITDACEQIGAMQLVKAGLVFKHVEKKYHDRIPIWNDELYLEVHRGVQTTLHRLKQQNRNAEVDLQTIEKLYSLLTPFGIKFDKKLIDQIWKKVLFNQFHDILPGTSIQEVYEDTDLDYNEFIFPNIKKLYESAFSSLINSLPITDIKGKLLIFYPNHWEQIVKLKVENQIYYHKKPSGIGFEVISLDTLMNSSLNNQTTIKIKEIKEKQLINIETKEYILSIDTNSGSISRLIINGIETDLCQNKLNILRLFEEHPNGNEAWNIDPFYRDKPCKPIKILAHSIENLNNQIKIVFSFEIGEKSSGTLIYEIAEALPYIECEININWQEAHKFLRVEFDTTLDGEIFTTGIPYGWNERPTKHILPLDKGRWEVPGNKFINLNTKTNSHGIAVMVYDKYGFHVDEGQFGVSLLRAPSYGNPDKEACAWYDPSKDHERKLIKDLGTHQIRWAIYPHKNDWKQANVYQHAINYNFPPKIESISKIKNLSNPLNKNSTINLTHFPVQCNSDNILISVIKPPYDQEAVDKGEIIIRFFEFMGVETECEFEWFYLNEKKALICDLLEFSFKGIKEVQVDKSKIKFSIKPFEIKSIRLF
jgi:alpha-mannosidase